MIGLIMYRLVNNWSLAVLMWLCTYIVAIILYKYVTNTMEVESDIHLK